ncbi:acetylxylan esterase [Pelagicoccus sp. SDUM812002]|uniref:acetylxylan esterase n=1 Tax=Pelagicoccus sp. SDUM812002 TaxID=3041266 RepID=UPI002810729D|nr:acetylxylan esterase [Pelagicoccus sp. SDUM812002]MDQ8186591.1 acetylxylan esterase [Pelagicoccus sp. SDUM812002]
MKLQNALIVALLLTVPALLSAAQLKLSLNKTDGVYQKGETVELSFSADSEQDAPLQLKIQKNNQEVVDQTLALPSGTSNHTFQYTFNEAGSIIFEAHYGDASDTIGIVISPDELNPGSQRPQDFDTYWTKEKARSKELRLKVDQQAIELDPSESGHEAYDVEINSPGPQPMRAIFAKPANAQPGTLPIVIQYRAAGVKGEWCRANTHEALKLSKRGNGALALDTNAHGMLNHEEEAYYEDLESGPLKNYSDLGNTDRDAFYFRFMYHRMLRSIEFMTRQPEWDGKRILVIGESQGGGQALAAVGLDPRVTAAVVNVPAMCDWGGPLAGRKGGWPKPIDWNKGNPEILEAVPYFDAAHLLTGSQATIFAEIGLIDQTCPSTSIYAALNQADGKVISYPVTYREHGWPKGEDREHWDVHAFAARNAFIEDYLK